MSNKIQCNRCGLKCETCGHYNWKDSSLCEHYVLPLDNSKKFAHWYNFKGRIGRVEYFLTLLAAVVLYVIIFNLALLVLSVFHFQFESYWGLYVFTFICSLPSDYLALAAGVKRLHDNDKNWIFALAPMLAVFIPNILVWLFVLSAVIYMMDAGVEGINEYGSNPAQPYDEQIKFDLPTSHPSQPNSEI